MSEENRPLDPIPILDPGDPSLKSRAVPGTTVEGSSYSKCPDGEVWDLAGQNLFSALLELDVRISFRPGKRLRPGDSGPEFSYTIADPDGGKLLTGVTRTALEEWTRWALDREWTRRTLSQHAAANPGVILREAVTLGRQLSGPFRELVDKAKARRRAPGRRRRRPMTSPDRPRAGTGR